MILLKSRVDNTTLLNSRLVNARPFVHAFVGKLEKTTRVNSRLENTTLMNTSLLNARPFVHSVGNLNTRNLWFWDLRVRDRSFGRSFVYSCVRWGTWEHEICEFEISEYETFIRSFLCSVRNVRIRDLWIREFWIRDRSFVRCETWEHET